MNALEMFRSKEQQKIHLSLSSKVSKSFSLLYAEAQSLSSNFKHSMKMRSGDHREGLQARYECILFQILMRATIAIIILATINAVLFNC